MGNDKDYTSNETIVFVLIGFILGIALGWALFGSPNQEEPELIGIKDIHNLCKDTNIIEIYFNRDLISEQYYYEGDYFPTQQYFIYEGNHTITLYSHYEDTCDEIKPIKIRERY